MIGGYRRLFTRFRRHWDKQRLFYEKDLIDRPKDYEKYRWGNMETKIGKDLPPAFEVMKSRVVPLINTFYRRYPDIRYTYGRNQPGKFGKQIKNPAVIFVEKQMKLMEEGFTEDKAFEIVEKDMAKVFERQREENRVS